MRKALITLLAAATILTPAAAMAQRGERRNYVPDDPNPRAERVQQRSEARQQRQEQRQSQPQQQQQQVAQNDRRGGGDRGNRGGWRGNDGNRGGSDANGGRGGDRANWRGGNEGQTNAGRNWRGNDGQSDASRNWRGGNRGGGQQGYVNDGRRGDRDWRSNDGRDGRNWRGNDGRDGRNWRGNDGRNWRGDNDRRRWDRNWRNDRRYDWGSWRSRNRNIFRVGRYYSPYRDWGYNRFSIGVFLEPLFYGRDYWIGDPWQYRLPPAYPGTQWVRYYNDVLLVDVYSGEVLDVIHDFFW